MVSVKTIPTIGGVEMSEYPTLRKLRAGEIIDIEGIKLKMVDGEIEAGDLYVAERNMPPQLLTAREIVMAACGCCISYIHSTCTAYSFDGGECVKVCEA